MDLPERPYHGGYPDNLLGRVTPPQSFTICHAILPPKEQAAISLAARYARDNCNVWAEQERAKANYDNLHYRPDADRRSGTV